MSNITGSNKAFVLIAHGSRLSQTADEMLSLIADLSKIMGEVEIRGAFMELQDPGLDEVVADLVDQGANQIMVLPLFIFNGRHMLEDIPAQVENCRTAYPDVEFTLMQHIGETDSFRESITKILVE
jgi:sirohydrochlorin ferrochelatase